MNNIEFTSLNEIVSNVHLKILEHGFLHAGTDWNFLNLSSPFNRLYFVLSGNASIRNPENEMEMTGGNVYVVPLYNTYDYVCSSELNKFYVHFRIELMPGHDLFEGCMHCISLPVDQSVMEELIRSAAANQVGDFIICKGILLNYIERFLTLKHQSQRLVAYLPSQHILQVFSALQR